MFTLRKSCLLSVLVGMVLCPAVSFGQASALPNKPVRIVVPNAAAGPNDLVARLIAPKLSETLGQNVIVDNRPSANGVIGAEYVARALGFVNEFPDVVGLDRGVRDQHQAAVYDLSLIHI